MDDGDHAWVIVGWVPKQLLQKAVFDTFIFEGGWGVQKSLTRTDPFHLIYHLILQMPILTIGPGKPKMCIQENLVDCADYCFEANLDLSQGIKINENLITMNSRGAGV